MRWDDLPWQCRVQKAPKKHDLHSECGNALKDLFLSLCICRCSVVLPSSCNFHWNIKMWCLKNSLEIKMPNVSRGPRNKWIKIKHPRWMNVVLQCKLICTFINTRFIFKLFGGKFPMFSFRPLLSFLTSFCMYTSGRRRWRIVSLKCQKSQLKLKSVKEDQTTIPQRAF